MTEEQQTTNHNSTALAPVTPTPAALSATPQQASLVSPFSNQSAFESAQRMAKALASSSLVPAAYQGNVPNCLIGMEIASRIGVSVLAAMQNLDIIHGNPSWRAKFLIATVNASGQFTKLRFEWTGTAGKPDWGCRAHAKDKSDGELCVGPWVTWEMANKEGWVKKNGSKWQTLAELMFCYRAAAFWTRLYCPEISLGFHTSEEMHDVYGETVATVELPPALSPAGAKTLEGILGLQREADEAVDAPQSEPPPPMQPAEDKQQTLLDAKGKK